MRQSPGGSVTPALVGAGLLALTGWHFLGWHPAAAWLAGINVATGALFWYDKRQAVAGGWRVPESDLLAMSFIGGSPGAFVFSQMFRHKTKKVAFRVQFWCVVVLQIALAAAVYYRIDRLLPPVRQENRIIIEDAAGPSTEHSF